MAQNTLGLPTLRRLKLSRNISLKGWQPLQQL